MTAKRKIRHQHYRLRLSDPKATPTYVAGLLRSTRNEIIPHKTTMKAMAWRTCNHPMALALKGQLLVLCGVEATIEVCHYPGKKRMPLPEIPPLLSQEEIDSLSFSMHQGINHPSAAYTATFQAAVATGFACTQKQTHARLTAQALRQSGKSTIQTQLGRIADFKIKTTR